MSEEGHSPQYTEHRAESDKAAETIKDLVLMNKIMHDGLSEAQTMIGERELKIARLELELQDAQNQILLLTSRATRHITLITN